MAEDKRIHVLQLVEGFGGGGAERKLLELVREMDETRFRTVVCSLGFTNTLQKEFESLDAKTVTFRRRGRFNPRLFFQLLRLVRREQIDVIMTTLFYADIVGALVGRLAKVKAVFFWETISSPGWLTWHRKWLYKLAAGSCTRIVSVSRATADFVVDKREIPSHKVVVIPYGIDLAAYAPKDGARIRESIGLNRNDPVIGMVGRLQPQKGHRYLVKAMEKVVKTVPDVKVVLVGWGGLQDEIETQIEEAGLKDHFVLLGLREDVSDLLNAFDIFTLPSLWEGLPNVILEAMATAKPVVASSVDGNAELVLDGATGFLVPPKDVDRLADALVHLLTHKDEAARMGRKGRKRVEEEFSLRQQVQRFQDLYLDFSG